MISKYLYTKLKNSTEKVVKLLATDDDIMFLQRNHILYKLITSTNNCHQVLVKRKNFERIIATL